MEKRNEAKSRPGRRARRVFTDEFKAGAVQLVVQEGRSVSAVAQDLDLTRSVVGHWVRQARANAGTGPVGALTSTEKEELARLRREIKVLRMEREILKNNPPTRWFWGPETGDHVDC